MAVVVGENSVVSMHYTLKDDSGKELDSSAGAEPLTYLHGAGNIIPGLENALVGKTDGDSVQVRVEPADGYGEVLEELTHTVELSAFQGAETVEPGMSFEARGENGAAQRIVVKSVDGDKVTIDANHPLAGVALSFDVQIVSVRQATEEEVAHGHVH